MAVFPVRVGFVNLLVGSFKSLNAKTDSSLLMGDPATAEHRLGSFCNPALYTMLDPVVTGG